MLSGSLKENLRLIVIESQMSRCMHVWRVVYGFLSSSSSSTILMTWKGSARNIQSARCCS